MRGRPPLCSGVAVAVAVLGVGQKRGNWGIAEASLGCNPRLQRPKL